MIASNTTTVMTQTSGETTETTVDLRTARSNSPEVSSARGLGRDRHRRVGHGAVRDDDGAARGILPSTNVQNYSPLGRTLSTRVPQGRKRVWPCGDFANASAFATGTLNT